MKDSWILLDIDGTISPKGRLPSREKVHVGSGPSGNVAIPESMASRVAALVENPDIRLAWYTMWGDDANEIVAPALGMEPLPVIPYAGGHDAPAFLKATGLLQWKEAGRHEGRFAILDDDPPEGVDLPTDVRVFAVDSRKGLQQADIDSALSWLAQE